MVIAGLKVSLVSLNHNLALQLSLIAAVWIAFLSTPQTNYSVAITDAVTLDLNGNTWGCLRAAGNVTVEIVSKRAQREKTKYTIADAEDILPLSLGVLYLHDKLL